MRMTRTQVLAMGVLLVVAFGLIIGFTSVNSGRIEEAQSEVAALEAAGAGEDEIVDAKRHASAQSYGVLTLLPPFIAIVLSFLTRNVVLSLMIGAFAGIFMGEILAAGFASAMFASFMSLANSMISQVADPWNAGVIMQCLTIGGLIALVTKMGGMHAVASALSKRARSARSAQAFSWLAGLLVFFDDYANALIVGPVMRPITDKMRVSREKLAFIVDATAAPVAGLMFVSTWIATEVSAIQEGFAQLPGGYSVMGGASSAYSVFINSIPYRYYNIFLLLFIIIGIYMAKEFGPMLRAEARARKHGVTAPLTGLSNKQEEEYKPDPEKGFNIWDAIVPLGALIAGAIGNFYYNGYQAAVSSNEILQNTPFSMAGIREAFASADASVVLFQAALFATIIAFIMGVARKKFTAMEGVNTFISGCKSLFITAIILTLAWTLNSSIKELGTRVFLVNIVSGSMPAFVLPSVIFIIGCLISFSTGTSYGTMLILTPLTIPVAYAMRPEASFITLCVGAVLAGAIFGDHCSPISDTTILSSMGADCDHMEHTKTQLVYAVVVAGISIVAGYLLAGLGVNVWLTLAIGIAMNVGVFVLFGRNPGKTEA